MSKHDEANRTFPDEAALLNHLKHRKKLFLGAKREDVIRNALTKHRFAAKTASNIMKKTDQIHQMDLLDLRYEPGRKVILPTSRALFDRITTLTLANILNPSPRHVTRIINETLKMVALDDWNDQHFLCTAEMTVGVSLALNWFFDEMSPIQRDKIMNAIINFALIPGLKQIENDAFWVTSQSNWNSVCTSGLVLGSIGAAPLVPSLSARTINKCMKILVHGNQAFGIAGDHVEGPTYWTLALNYTVYRDEALREIGIDPTPIVGLGNCLEFARDVVGPSGLCYNYGDTTTEIERPRVLGWLANSHDSSKIAHWQHEYDNSDNPFDLIWLSNPTHKTELKNTNPYHASYERSGITVIRHKMGLKSVYVAISTGSNDRDHTHLDLLSFILEKGKTRFISDLGRDNYALPGYFDPSQRFEYIRTQTAGHSSLICNGDNQSTDAFCKLIASNLSNDVITLKYELVDIHKPFQHFRSFLFTGDDLIIKDDIIRKNADPEPIDLTWQLFSSAQIKKKGAKAKLSLNHESFDCEILSASASDWKTESVKTGENEYPASNYIRLFFLAKLEKKITISVRMT